jgi:diaminopimelate epimerase
VDFLNTGVPHAVIFVDDIETVSVEKIGKEIRNCALFAPEGTNVTFAQLREGNSLSVRTFERGVEGETLACGTGATAAALVACKKFNYTSPIQVQLRSKERLIIGFVHKNDQFDEVTCQGMAKKLGL